MKLSVVIPCYNAAETLPVQLEALAGQQWSEPWEVIVSDNGSTDGSVGIAERSKNRLPNLRMVDASDRRGAGHARNVGIHTARGEAIALCDADDEVAPGWLEAMGRALSQHDFVACRIDFKKLSAPWTPDYRSDVQDRDVQRLWYPPYLPHAGGGTLGFKRSLCLAIGGFDETMPELMDTDFCLRLQLAGVPLHFVPEAVVHVRARHSNRGLFRQSRMRAFGNVLIYKRYRSQPTKPELWRWKHHLRDWKTLVSRLPQIRSKTGRAGWVNELGWHIGELTGSLKYGVPPIPFE